MPAGRKLVWGWHIDVICDHLQAITERRIQRLLINVPPRHMKSLLVSVFWPAWEWLHYPELRYLSTSYADGLSMRDSDRMRRLVCSDVYQSLVEYASETREIEDFYLRRGSGEKRAWENTAGGQRLATSVLGTLTGLDGDRIIVDDPHNVVEQESDIKRGNVIIWFDESLSSRIIDPDTSAFVIIMQRIHEEDLSGHVLEESHSEEGECWSYLCLPGLYEGFNRSDTALGFVDPRETEGEPLWPERFNARALQSMVKGVYAQAGQIQQRPSPRGGGFFIGDFKIIKTLDELPSPVVTWVRYWDKASSEGQGTYTSGVLMGLCRNNTFVITDIVRGQWAKPKREKIIRETAESDGYSVETYVEQEAGGGGKESAEDTIKNLAGYKVYADRVTGDKEVRAEPYGIQQMEGNIYVLDRSWTPKFLEEHESFPKGKYKDIVDSTSGAFNMLTQRITVRGGW